MRYPGASIGVALNAGARVRRDAPAMESIVIPAEELDARSRELRRVRAWRVEQLRRLGLAFTSADVFADLVDYHAVAALVERGCPPELALEIVR